AEARANAQKNPQPKQEEAGKTITTDQGIMQWNPATQKYDIPVGKPPSKEGDLRQFADENGLYWALHPDGTASPVNGPDGHQLRAKVNDKVPTHTIQREVNGKPHNILVDSQTGDDIRDLGEVGEKPPVVNVNANERADRKEQQAGKQASFKAYTPALDSAERFNVMAKNYEDAVK